MNDSQRNHFHFRPITLSEKNDKLANGRCTPNTPWSPSIKSIIASIVIRNCFVICVRLHSVSNHFRKPNLMISIIAFAVLPRCRHSLDVSEARNVPTLTNYICKTKKKEEEEERKKTFHHAQSRDTNRRSHACTQARTYASRWFETSHSHSNCWWRAKAINATPKTVKNKKRWRRTEKKPTTKHKVGLKQMD